MSMSTSTASLDTNTTAMIASAIRQLRPRLLDLSRRNPLLATRFAINSSSVVRAVDELPDAISQKLHDGESFRFAPLPPLEEGCFPDEETPEFLNAFAQARLEDSAFLAATADINPEAEENIDRIQTIERELRDRLRTTLGMPPRREQLDHLSLHQHAVNNGISPYYDLPPPNEIHADGRHNDNLIQTLLLPEQLERKLNAISLKERTWEQETGINPLKIAFGFLEWQDPKSSKSCMAPLTLMPVQLKKVRTKSGSEFFLSAAESEIEGNVVLEVMFRENYSVNLLRYEDVRQERNTQREEKKSEKEVVEEYFERISGIQFKDVKCKVRRQIAIGVFPSSQMAMYVDTGRDERDLEKRELIGELFTPSTRNGTSLYEAGDKDDDATLENQIIGLVLDSDSSQFRVIAETVAGTKNLAVEGPPGSGKSQTIVNVIANAMAAGQKVLFVAEKMAALEVVRSRIEDVGLGDYVLSLHATRSGREEVIKSVKNGLERRRTNAPDVSRLPKVIADYRRIRSILDGYVGKLTKSYEGAGEKVYRVIGRGISESDELSDLPFYLQRPDSLPSDAVGAMYADLDNISAHAEKFASAWESARTTASFWEGLINIGDGMLVRDTMRADMAMVIEALERGAAKRSRVEALGLPVASLPFEQIERVIQEYLTINVPTHRNLLIRAIQFGVADTIAGFIMECRRCQRERDRLAKVASDPDSLEIATKFRELHSQCTTSGESSIQLAEWRRQLIDLRQENVARRNIYIKLNELIELYPDAMTVPAGRLSEAADLVRETAPEVFAACSSALYSEHAIGEGEALCRTARELLERRRKIAEELDVENSFYLPEQLEACSAILGKTGLFGRFLSPYRTALNVYRELCVGTRRDRHRAATLLKSLAAWKRSLEEFSKNEKGVALFGSNFTGMESDFEFLAKVIAYARKAREVTDGSHEEQIRGLVFSGRRRVAAALCALPENMPLRTRDELLDDLHQGDEAIASRTAFIEKVSPLLSILVEQDNFPVSQLSSIANRIEALAAARRNLDENTRARDVFCEDFAGNSTITDTLDGDLAVLELVKQNSDSTATIQHLLESNSWQEAAEAVSDLRHEREMAAKLFAGLGKKYGFSFFDRIEGMSPDESIAYFRRASEDVEGFRVHAELAFQQAGIEDAGLLWLIDAFKRENIEPKRFPAVTRAIIARATVAQAEKHCGALVGDSRNSGATLGALRAELSSLDREMTELMRREVERKIRAAYTPVGGRSGRHVGDLTEMQLITHEMGKTKQHIPIRELTRRAGRALRELKPCWMMSPLAVSRYLPRDGEPFDLCIIDEASQMTPENALGALLRAKQVMVVGDTNQLPPSNFFRSSVDSDTEDDDENAPALELESILDLANASFQPSRRLRWHYRSRHQSLIQFSNHHVYDDDLIVFPTPIEAGDHLGVSLVRVDGDYHKGLNGKEAAILIEAAAAFMRAEPGRSLGIATFNAKQSDLLNEEMELLRERDPAIAAYIDKWSENLDSFFIKNLENVQGDERDVIMIGTLYGSDKTTGKFSQQLGPITQAEGKRRLNVLFTRARQRIVTFTSMQPSDLTSASPGVQMLKAWLEYSAAGGIMPTPDDTGADADSPFEEYVAEQIRKMGFDVVLQVGVSGYRVDIGVRHPHRPNEFILGVECDGESYHSHRSARDRDRLRDEVLEGLGWRLYRIWSYDWFNDPKHEIKRLRETLEQMTARSQQKHNNELATGFMRK